MFSHTNPLPDIHPKVFKAFSNVFPNIELKTSSTLEDLKSMIDGKRSGIFIYHVSNTEELQKILVFLPTIQEAIIEKSVYIAVFMAVNSVRVDHALIKLGVVEIFRYDLPEKALFHKLRRYIANLSASGSGQKSNNTEEFKIKGDSSKNSKIISNKLGIELVEPLETPFDYWLMRKVPYIHRYQGQWMIEMIGPSPSAAKWTKAPQYQHLFPGEEQIWEWVKREHIESFGEVFGTKPASWVFTGKKPEYSWTVNRWAFISETPALHLIEDGKVTQTRFLENEDGILQLSENSEIAKNWFYQIKQTYDRNHYIDVEKSEFGEKTLIDPEVPGNIPWADKLDSKNIPPAAWKVHQIIGEENPEWKKLERIETKEEIEEKMADEISSSFEVPLGANAMKDCGIHASMNGDEIELMGYSENQPIILIGTQLDLILESAVEVDIISENMNSDLTFKLHGKVIKIEKDDLARFIATILLNSESHLKISKIRDAVQRRQLEVFEFFKKAKG